jgi:hypothetical protein
MAAKTLAKLEALCDEHDLEMDAHHYHLDGWLICFYAPDNMFWNSTDGVSAVYNHDNIRLALRFLRGEIAEGFRPIRSDDLH